MADSRVCDNCGRWVEPNEIVYTMRVIIEAEAPDEIEIDEVALSGDSRRELEELLNAMEQMSEDEVDEAVDQVHEHYEFLLCPSCRVELHRRMKTRSRIIGPD